MMTTVFIRVVPQDKDRGYMLLVGFDPTIVQRTAAQYMTLNAVTRFSFDRVIAGVRQHYSAGELKDVTAKSIAKKLQKDFGEVQTGNLLDPPVKEEVKV